MSNHHSDRAEYVTADAVASCWSGGHFYGDLTLTYRIRNSSHRTMYVTTRDGITYTLPPQPGVSGNAGFQVHYEIQTTGAVKTDSRATLNVSDDELSVMHRICKDTMKPNTQLRTGEIQEVMYEILIHNLERMGGSVYVRNLDLCVSINPIEYVEPHPYSPEGILNRHEQDVADFTPERGFGYTIKIVDNHKQIDPRYINISGIVYRIPISTDETMQNGVYITYKGRADNLFNQTNVTTDHYPLETIADKCPFLYRTIEDASHYGDVVARMSEELEREKLKSARDQLDNKQRMQEWEFDKKKQQDMHERETTLLKQQIDKEAALMKEEKDKLEHQRTLLEQERKDHYERRSYERKDSSELWKMIPVVIAGVLAAKAIFK